MRLSFGIYFVAYIVLIVGFALGAHALHVEPRWVAVGVLAFIEVAIVHAVMATRQKDSPY